MGNNFRNKAMRGQYDEFVRHFETRAKVLFHEGVPHRGNSWAGTFWGGYAGYDRGAFNFDAAAKKTLAYAIYRAGQDCRKADDQFADTCGSKYAAPTRRAS